MSTTSAERENFSSRLISALASAHGLDASPTTLSREFNRVFAGSQVTVHAVRKWLLGQAIPTQEKMQALATWLNVSAEWLRFGSEDLVNGQTASAATRQAATSMDGFLRLYLTLPMRERAMTRDFIAMLGKQRGLVPRRAQPAPERVSQSVLSEASTAPN